jgi:hypothetical protein
MTVAERKEAFLAGLVGSHAARPALALPHWRALIWFVGCLAVSVLLALLVQAFRPGFVGQLLQHPVLLAEVVSAMVLAGLGGYMALVLAIPGERVPRPAWVAAVGSGVVLAAALVLGFTHLAPPSSTVGARHMCWLEVLVYGGLGLGLLLVMLHRGYPRMTFGRRTALGLAAGLPPAAIMQLACMYDPSHAMQFHYGPVLVLVVLGLGLSLLLRRR